MLRDLPSKRRLLHTRRSSLPSRQRRLCRSLYLLLIATSVISRGVFAAEPVLIAGVQEPPEMKVAPYPTIVLSPPWLMLKGESKDIDSWKTSNKVVPVLNKVLAKYSYFADGYAMRGIMQLCFGTDRAAALTDINRALKDSSNLSKEISVADLLSMRAKLERLSGQDELALQDLMNAIESNPKNAKDFVNSGAVKPEASAGPCVWSNSDFDYFIDKYPNDYRVFIMKGLYYSFFMSFNQDPALAKTATDNFQKAALLNPASPLPHYLLARMLASASFITAFSAPADRRSELYEEPIAELTQANLLKKDYEPALADRANLYLDSDKFKEALDDYNQALTLEPRDEFLLDGHGHAELGLGNYSQAAKDFGQTIEVQTNPDYAEYETRANTYMKLENWDGAIADYTTAISLFIGKQFPLINIGQFRALYPEYSGINDAVVARKLQRTFLPNETYEQFAKGFIRKTSGWALDVSLYEERSQAYMQAGRWREAAADYNRARRAAPSVNTSIEGQRWTPLIMHSDSAYYLDLKTLSFIKGGRALLWIKEIDGSGNTDGPGSVSQYEIDCKRNSIRTNSVTNYNSAGDPISSSSQGPWGPPVPDTLGEYLSSHICKS